MHTRKLKLGKHLFGVVGLLLLLLLGTAGGAGAQITAPSASLDTTGKIVTVNVSGIGTGPLLPASGLSGFTVESPGGVVWPVASETAGATTATVNLLATIPAGTAVTLVYDAPGGNLTDSAGTPNKLAPVSSLAVTNNSTVTPAAFTDSLNAAGGTGELSTHTPTVGAATNTSGWTWTNAATATMTLTAGRLTQTTPNYLTPTTYQANTTSSGPNALFSTDIYVASGPGDEPMTLAVLTSGTGGTAAKYSVALRPNHTTDLNNFLSLTKMVNGTGPTLTPLFFASSIPAIVVGTTYTFRIEVYRQNLHDIRGNLNVATSSPSTDTAPGPAQNVINLYWGPQGSPSLIGTYLDQGVTITGTSPNRAFTANMVTTPGQFTVGVTTQANQNFYAFSAFSLAYSTPKPGPVVAPVASYVSASDGAGGAASTVYSASQTMASAFDGVPPYTVALYRSPVLNDPTVSGTTALVTTLAASAPTLTTTDSAAPYGAAYYYRYRATDSVAGTADSPQVLQRRDVPLYYGCIGDSIHTAGGWFPLLGQILSAAGNGRRSVNDLIDTGFSAGQPANTSVYNAAVSGQTTTSYLPGSSLYNHLKLVWNGTADGSPPFSLVGTAPVAGKLPTVVGITLGANNAHDPSTSQYSSLGTVAAYRADLIAICNGLLTDIPSIKKIVVHAPIYSTPGAYGGIWTPDSPEREAQYATVLAGVATTVNAGRATPAVFVGDTTGFSFFQANPSLLGTPPSDGAHPNGTGAPYMATMEAVATARILFPPTVATGTKRRLQ